MTKWRLVDTGVKSAAENMALDEVILTARQQGKVPNTLRFLQFAPKSILVGYHQCMEDEVRLDYCNQNNIEINRRITGGGTILFDETQLGWELIAESDGDRIPYNLEAVNKKICNTVVDALKSIGIKAEFRPRNDIEINGRKISGTGGTGTPDGFLFQGTLLMDFDIQTMLMAMRIPTEKLSDKEIDSAGERVTCLKMQLGYLPLLDDIKSEIIKAFEKSFDVEFQVENLSEYEENLFNEKLPYFQSQQWINKIAKQGHQEIIKSLYRSKGGIIKINMKVDKTNSIISSMLITGDFFTYPNRVIFDLENKFKHVKATYEKVEEIIREFFDEVDYQIIGVTPEDFMIAIQRAIDKIAYTSFNIRESHINSLFTVREKLRDVLKEGRADTVLVPYCSKKVGCEYRFKNDCVECGQCTAGDFYRMAREKGLRVITILNFEHLKSTLRKLGAEKSLGFIGSCCEAFYLKHFRHFEGSGVPGILVDVDSTTCYDLGKIHTAKKGEFENQTDLNVELLGIILNYF